MGNAGFGEYRNKVFRLYEEKRFGEALEAAQEASQNFPEYDAKTSFWIACLQNRLGNQEASIRTLQMATKRGVWWRSSTLQDSDLDPIRGRREFAAIEEECRRLQDEAPRTAEPELMVRNPLNYSPDSSWPALMVFHARYGERPEVSAEEWLPILSAGAFLAAPWSSQVYGWDGRSWDDWEVAEEDVKWSFSQLSKYRVDPNRLILGGFSQGAALAIYSTLKRVIPSRGFVAVASSDWVRPEEKPATERTELSEPFANFVKATDCSGLRGVIIIGDKDGFYPKIRQLYSLMQERGLKGQFLVQPGVGHEYPQRFGPILTDAVKFVLTGI